MSSACPASTASMSPRWTAPAQFRMSVSICSLSVMSVPRLVIGLDRADRRAGANSSLPVVGDPQLLARRQRLADQADPIGQVLRVEHLVALQLHLALEDHAGTRAAVALAAGERRVDALLLEELQEH